MKKPEETKELRDLMEEAKKAHIKLLKVVERLETKFLDDEVGQEPPNFTIERLRNGKH